jgi:hypothetical protein
VIAKARFCPFPSHYLPIWRPACRQEVLAVGPWRRDHRLWKRRRRMTFSSGEIDPSQFPGGGSPARNGTAPPSQVTSPNQVTFSRLELNRILDLYGRKVAAGEWRDYAIDFLKDRAVFSVFRRASEVPLYRIEKNPKLARKQGAYSVVSATGLIVRRGPELDRVLRAIDVSLSLVAG